MKNKNKIVIVTDAALDRMEMQQKRNKMILTIVGIIVGIALLVGGIFCVMNFRSIVNSIGNKCKQIYQELTTNDPIDKSQSKDDQANKGQTGDEQVGDEQTTEAATEVTTQVEENQYPVIESDKKVKDHKGVVTVGDTAYELFTYREASAKSYAKAVNKLAKQLDGKSNVYDMVIPLSSGIIFPDNLVGEIDSTDQRKAMTDIMGMMNDKVKSVDIYDSLMTHRNEYIYFRTDHHWTALGAYYAYTALCEQLGIEPEALADYETVDFEGFVGSFYKDTEEKALEKHPDVITAYFPKNDAKMTVTPAEGDAYEWDIINNVNDYGPSLKYSTFIASDNPMTVIENPEVTDGSSCVVVKESFGNAFVPFLVDHYQTIYVVDYRYWEGSLPAFVKEKKAQDVILLNNLSMIRNQYLVGQFQGVVE